jgi:hypothetical protein
MRSMACGSGGDRWRGGGADGDTEETSVLSTVQISFEERPLILFTDSITVMDVIIGHRFAQDRGCCNTDRTPW